MKSSINRATAVGEWRSRLISYSLLLAVIYGLIATIPSVIIATSTNHWLVLAVDLAAYVTVVVLWWFDRLPYGLRAGGFVASVIATGTVVIVVLGPWGAGIAWLFAGIVLATLFFGIRGWVLAAATFVITAATMGVLLHYGRIQWPIGPADWGVHATSVLAAATGVSFATHYLVSRIERAHKRQTHLNDVLKRQQRQLESHVNYQSELVRELHHRVRNNMQILLSLSSIPSGDDSHDFTQFQSRLECLSMAHDLTWASDPEGGVDAVQLITAVRDHVGTNLEPVAPGTWCTIGSVSVALSSRSTGAFALFVHELLQFWVSVHSAQPNCGCSLSLSSDKGWLRLTFSPRYGDQWKGEFYSAFSNGSNGSGGLIGALAQQFGGTLALVPHGETTAVVVTAPILLTETEGDSAPEPSRLHGT